MSADNGPLSICSDGLQYKGNLVLNMAACLVEEECTVFVCPNAQSPIASEQLPKQPLLNRPIPSCLKPLFQCEDKCEPFQVKMSFHSLANKTHFRRELLFKFQLHWD